MAKETPWLPTFESIDGLDQALAPGLFVKAWLEPQSALPGHKSASVGLFYICGRKPRNAFGIDVQARAVACRTGALMTALERGPFTVGPHTSLLHLCASPTCVGDSGRDHHSGGPVVHTVAVLVYARSELKETWYSEGIKALDELTEKESSIAPGGLPPYAAYESASVAGGKSSGEKKALAEAVGKLGAGDAWKLNPLNISKAFPSSDASGTSSFKPIAVLPTPAFPPAPGHDATDSIAGTSEAASLEQMKAELRKREAEQLVKLQAQSKQMDDMIQAQAEQLALYAAKAESRKADQRPGRSPSPERKTKSRKRSRSPSARGDKRKRSRRLSRSKGDRKSQKRRSRTPPRDRRDRDSSHRSRKRSSSRRAHQDRKEADRNRSPRRASPRTEARAKLPPRPSVKVPGLSHGAFGDELLDRKPGIFGAFSPHFKTGEVLKFMKAQIAYSDQVREILLEVQKKEKDRRGRKSGKSSSHKRKKSRRGDSSSSSDSRPRRGRSASSASAHEERKRDRLKYRLLAKERPGVMFATMAANARQSLGQYGVELDMGSQGPVFRKWWESSFTKEVSASRLAPYWDELFMLVTAMDEFHAGRVIEVGDILASRLRMLTVGLEKNTWRAARHFLVYHTQDLSLIPEDMMDDVLRIEKLEAKREKDLAAARVSDAKAGR